MKPDKRRSPAATSPSSIPGQNVTGTANFTSLGDAAEGAVRNLAPLYVSKRYRLPLTVARVVCELAQIGGRLG